MLSIDTRAGIKGGVVVLLVGTVFIGLCMGFVAYYSSNILGTGASTAQVTIDNQATEVTVSVYSFGPYESLNITVGNTSQTVDQTGEYTFKKPEDTAVTLRISGTTEKGYTEVFREETI